MNQFCYLIERVQYGASLAITIAIKGTSRLKVYKEIRLQFLRLISKISKIGTDVYVSFTKLEQPRLLFICTNLLPSKIMPMTPVI